MRQRKIWVIGIIASVGIGGLWAKVMPGAGPSAPLPRAAALPVTLVAAEVRDLPHLVEATGWVEPLARVAIRPRVEGQIAAVLVAEGALVKKGQVLFRLDEQSAEAELRQARAVLQQNMAQLDKVRREKDRAEKLARSGAVAQGQKEAAQANAGVLAAAIAEGKARSDAAAILLSYREIRAPLAGRIGEINIESGGVTRPGDSEPLTEILQVDPIALAFTLADRHLDAVRQAMAHGPVPVSVATADGAVTCKLSFIDSKIERSVGTVKLKADCPNPNGQLWPGQYSKVAVEIGQDRGIVTLPDEAVLTGQGGPFVFVAGADGRAEPRPVALLRRQDGLAVIGRGVAAGERVVVEGQSLLSPGDLLKPVAATPAGNGKS